MSQKSLLTKLINILKQRQNQMKRFELQLQLQPKLKLKPKPTPPESWECCGDSCPNCVWNLYFTELENYNILNKDLETKI